MKTIRWYIIIGLIAGGVAKSVVHMHLTRLWTIMLAIVGSLVGGCVTHMFSRPKERAQFHPAGIVFSILGALLVLFVWHTTTALEWAAGFAWLAMIVIVAVTLKSS
jgi:uncharacterized membrane protein YeaQ/YmgE (transglycosylase-associated protein family)